MEKQKHNFKATQSLSLGTSYGTIRVERDVELDVTVGIHDNTSGYYEIYDTKTSGEDWYAEGCLEFDQMDLVGYDGCFSLPNVVIDKLKELGYKDKL